MRFRFKETVFPFFEKYVAEGFPEAWRLAEVDAMEAYEAACEAKMDAKREER